MGVYTDSEGNVIVANKQRHQVDPFSRVGAPICLVFKGLGQPMGMAYVPQGQLMVTDTR